MCRHCVTCVCAARMHVQWIDSAEYHASRPDDIVLDQVNQTLHMLNNMFADELTVRRVL